MSVTLLTGDCRAVLATLPAASVQCVVTSPPKNDGRFVKGERRSVPTEFKPGQHWRPRKPHWEREWLVREYVTLGRSTGEIAAEIGTTDANVFHWLKKHGIARRNISEARGLKHWGSAGEANPMFGKRGALAVNWKGGCTPERQAFYASQEWADVLRLVWRRDRATCRRCHHKQKNGERAMDIHHIVSFAMKHLRAEASNLVLLCRPCHRFVHSRKNVLREFVG